MSERTSRREVQLVIMRFLSVLMSPFKTSKSTSKDGNKATDTVKVFSYGTEDVDIHTAFFFMKNVDIL